MVFHYKQEIISAMAAKVFLLSVLSCSPPLEYKRMLCNQAGVYELPIYKQPTFFH